MISVLSKDCIYVHISLNKYRGEKIAEMVWKEQKRYKKFWAKKENWLFFNFPQITLQWWFL